MNLSNPKFYNNRELSWLEFNERVLEEAQDKSNPLLERLKFLAITASNLDEFFMVRVSSIMDQYIANVSSLDPSGLTPEEQLLEISKRVHAFTTKQYNCLNRSILPSLAKENIFFLSLEDLSDEQTEYIKRYYDSTIYPILTPMAIDQSHPFPLLNSKSLNIIVELKSLKEKEEISNFALVQTPSVVSRIIELPVEDKDKKQFIFLEDIIKEYIDTLFTGYKVMNTSLFRITRNSDFEIDEEDTDDLLYEIEKSVKRRKWGDPVRIEIEKNMTITARDFLKSALDLDEDDIYEINGALDLTVWMGFSGIKGYDKLKNPPLTPQTPVDFIENEDIFSVIRHKDILVHHPYEAFDCVVNFVKAAATDPNVLAIKQTLYRVSGNSPIVNSLIQAAENGKQVTVMVELKARFDEENNINWAKKLEKSGCHVVYGLVGLKTHCKICLVVRKEEDGIRRYVHLGTGNYNDSTAKIYTDLGFFTCKFRYGQDVSSLFNVLTGYSKNTDWNKLSVAPITLRNTFLKYIEIETANANAGKDASIIAKMNSLVDVGIIQALYKASMAGVKIKLIVRGICCLKTNIPDVSENITVVSIVDRFLEHSRIFYFENAGNPKIFLSSADWMPRNLDRRVEVAFPIEDNELKEKIIEILDITLSDTVKLRELQPDGSYEKVDRRGKDTIHSQMLFYNMAIGKINSLKEEEDFDTFIPIYHKEEDDN